MHISAYTGYIKLLQNRVLQPEVRFLRDRQYKLSLKHELQLQTQNVKRLQGQREENERE